MGERKVKLKRLGELGKLMNDTRGQKLELGQLVDLQLIGMFRGQVVAVNEGVIAHPGRPPMPPHIIVDIQIPKFITGNGPSLQQIYIVQDAPAQSQQDASEDPQSLGGPLAS